MGSVRSRQLRSAAVVMAWLAGAGTAAADPPSRVARISFISGSVSFRPGTLDGWSAAALNDPMTTGDNLWSDPNGRAELQLGPIVARVAANTSLSVLNLDSQLAQFRLTQGTLAVTVRELLPDEAVEIDTPNSAVSLQTPGFYRIDVSLSGETTTVTVREGSASVSTDSESFEIEGRGSAVMAGLPDARIDRQAAVRSDEWEDWCQWRERRASSAGAERYVSRGMIGSDDLGEFGVWQMAPDYGPVWLPHVHPDWAPYRFGHWIWVEPWGWTWVDDAPWGFAPFHYGRWVRLAAGWAWVPGTVVPRPIYAPALVVFIGGPGWRVSAGSGEPVAWFPLGPREPFVPGYPVGPEYLRAINRSHVNITAPVDLGRIEWVNRMTPGGVTAVPRGVFVQGRPVGPAMTRVPADVVRAASVVGTVARVAPDAVSIVGQAVPRGAAPPPEVTGRRVIARTPPPAPPVPFVARRPALAAHPGEPVDAGTLGSLQPLATPGQTTQPVVRPVAPSPRNRPTREGAPPASIPPAEAPRPVPPHAAPAPRPNDPPRPSVPMGDLASRQAAERARLEAEHAAAQAKLRAQEDTQHGKARDERQRQEVAARQEQAERDLQERQRREHEQTEQRQQRETEKREEKERAKAVPRARP